MPVADVSARFAIRESRGYESESGGTRNALPRNMNANNEKVAVKKVTKNTLYSVRYFEGTTCSKRVGYKASLLARSDALAVVRFLKRRGVEAFAAPLRVIK